MLCIVNNAAGAVNKIKLCALCGELSLKIGRAGIARLLYKYWLHFGGQCPPYETILLPTQEPVLMGHV